MHFFLYSIWWTDQCHTQKHIQIHTYSKQMKQMNSVKNRKGKKEDEEDEETKNS